MVPKEYIGVWKRSLLRTKRGTHDTTSEAYWLQTEHLHCDLRIPTQALAVGSKPPSECSDDELQSLASQYAFAGHTQVEGELSTWYREIDFEPPGKPDVGRMTFVTPDILHEDDPDAASAAYHETWERVPGTSDPAQCWGVRLKASDGCGRKGFLLAAGDLFMFAADREQPLPTEAGCVKDLISNKGRSKQEKLDLLGFEVSYGSVRDWTVEVSTLPQQRGARLMKGEDHTASSDELRKALSNNTGVQLGAFPPKGGWRICC